MYLCINFIMYLCIITLMRKEDRIYFTDGVNDIHEKPLFPHSLD